jgi:hypothetical protein
MELALGIGPVYSQQWWPELELRLPTPLDCLLFSQFVPKGSPLPLSPASPLKHKWVVKTHSSGIVISLLLRKVSLEILCAKWRFR